MNLLEKKQVIPSGLTDNTGEFYVDLDKNEVYLSSGGKQIPFNEFPKEVLDIIHEDMNNRPVAMNALIEFFELVDLVSQTRQFIACRHGSFDSNPDIDVHGILRASEHVNCGRRGKCLAEGKLCTSIELEHGNLSANEIITLTEIGNGLIDKEIEEKTGFSIHTIRNHKDSISRKSGFTRKPSLGILAYRLGLVNDQI